MRPRRQNGSKKKDGNGSMKNIKGRVESAFAGDIVVRVDTEATEGEKKTRQSS